MEWPFPSQYSLQQLRNPLRLSLFYYFLSHCCSCLFITLSFSFCYFFLFPPLKVYCPFSFFFLPSFSSVLSFSFLSFLLSVYFPLLFNYPSFNFFTLFCPFFIFLLPSFTLYTSISFLLFNLFPSLAYLSACHTIFLSLGQSLLSFCF